MITLALVTGTYAIANRVGVSGPVAVAVAGLITGTHGARYAMSETTRANLTQFWNFTDEILNSLLFLMIGFEVVSIEFSWPALFAAGLAVPLSLVARFVSVAVPSLPLNLNSPRKGPALAILTWGGLRGALTVALALAVPAMTPARDVVIAMAFGVVLFTLVVQGLTLPPVIRRAGVAEHD
jgi:CPA1 family monovalent cation:H+ antiporter